MYMYLLQFFSFVNVFYDRLKELKLLTMYIGKNALINLLAHRASMWRKKGINEHNFL